MSRFEHGASEGAAPKLRMSTHRALLSGQALHRRGARHCAVASCGARLSGYNPDATCAVHGGWSDPPKRRPRRRSRAAGSGG